MTKSRKLGGEAGPKENENEHEHELNPESPFSVEDAKVLLRAFRTQANTALQESSLLSTVIDRVLENLVINEEEWRFNRLDIAILGMVASQLEKAKIPSISQLSFSSSFIESDLAQTIQLTDQRLAEHEHYGILVRLLMGAPLTKD